MIATVILDGRLSSTNIYADRRKSVFSHLLSAYGASLIKRCEFGRLARESICSLTVCCHLLTCDIT